MNSFTITVKLRRVKIMTLTVKLLILMSGLAN